LSRASTRLLDPRKVALGQANEVRSKRAKLKAQLRDGKVRLEEVFVAPADYLATAEVFDLLVAVPKIGPVKASRLLSMARVNHSTTVGQLSDRQRARLMELLSTRHRDAL
jgi:hypothetical protein